jgi:hypothetical protein
MRGTFLWRGRGDMGAGRAVVLSAGQGPRNRSDPGHWRALADQARRNADRVRDPNIKATILTIAERFERLALRAHALEHGALCAPALGAQQIPATELDQKLDEWVSLLEREHTTTVRALSDQR